jgi:hypothetical protein
MEARSTSSHEDAIHEDAVRPAADDRVAERQSEDWLSHYAALLDQADLSLLSTAFSIAAADLEKAGLPFDEEELQKAILLEGMGRKMGAGEVASIVVRRIRAGS